MSDKLSIEEENELLITRLAQHAGYDLEQDKEKAGDEDKMPDMSLVERLRMINEEVNQKEATV